MSLLEWNILVDVLIAAGLGGMIGAEREWAGKPAGLRTHIIVAIAAAMIVHVGRVLLLSYEAIEPQAVSADPTRLVHSVVVGISFLGAGTIFFRRDGGVVEGLTTAASILLVAVLGMTVAAEARMLALTVTILCVIHLAGVGRIEMLLQKRRPAGKHRDRGGTDV